MKILYAIQGTGNGHLSRAEAILPHFKKEGKVDVLISGIQYDIPFSDEIKYKFYGLSFIFGKNGGIDFYKTYQKSRLKNLYKEIKNLEVKKYDLIINDFEPVSSWAARKAGVPCIGLSNQAAVLSEGAPQPKKFDPIGKLVLNYYAPTTESYGFHFAKYNPNIYTPIIREEIRNLKFKNEEHILVYLPSFDEAKIIKRISGLKKYNFHIFSKHSKTKYTGTNYKVFPLDRKSFLKSFESCSGVITGAGFATTSEALFAEKKLMVIPMKSQFEQQCNALALKKMNVSVLKSLKSKHQGKLEYWLKNASPVIVNYPDETSKIVSKIVSKHGK